MTSSAPGLSRFWKAVARARHRLLLLDYDGTLAPFRVARRRAVPSRGVRSLLRRIVERGRTTVAVVSGRPVAEILSLLDPPGIWIVGEHGWESRPPGGTTRARPLGARSRRALDGAAREAEALGWGARLERKRSSVVLHLRGASARAARAAGRSVAARWRRRAARGGLELSRIDGGWELRDPAWNKGRAVRELLAGALRGAVPVYVGDDRTDEDAFRALGRGGFGIRVGRKPRRSRARLRLSSCRSVVAFLDRWSRTDLDRRPPDGEAT